MIVRGSIGDGRPLRVLIVENSETDLLLLLAELDRGGYRVSYRRVETKDALRAALRDGDWDVVLSDFSLPAMTGHDVVTIVTVRAAAPALHRDFWHHHRGARRRGPARGRARFYRQGPDGAARPRH